MRSLNDLGVKGAFGDDTNIAEKLNKFFVLVFTAEDTDGISVPRLILPRK